MSKTSKSSHFPNFTKSRVNYFLLFLSKNQPRQEESYQSNVIRLNELQRFRDEITNKLKKARLALAIQQSKLKEMRKGKVRQQSSIKTKVFAVLKEIGVITSLSKDSIKQNCSFNCIVMVMCSHIVYY